MFAVLVVATIAAFFTTQLLKSEFPLVLRFATRPAHFSPNGDDYRDDTRVGFDLSEPAEETFSVVDGEGMMRGCIGAFGRFGLPRNATKGCSPACWARENEPQRQWGVAPRCAWYF